MQVISVCLETSLPLEFPRIAGRIFFEGGACFCGSALHFARSGRIEVSEMTASVKVKKNLQISHMFLSVARIGWGANVQQDVLRCRNWIAVTFIIVGKIYMRGMTLLVTSDILSAEDRITVDRYMLVKLQKTTCDHVCNLWLIFELSSVRDKKRAARSPPVFGYEIPLSI